MPKVSILIPVYNRENLIGECIQSALDQSVTDFEVIITDNASTDRTWEICMQYAVKDKRIKIFRNETNIGPVRNWLRCVQEAQGEIGKILFSDDLMLPQFLEYTLPYIMNNEVAFVATAAIIGELPSNGTVYCPNPIGKQQLTVTHYLNLLLEGSVHYSPGAAIFRMKDIRANLLVTIPTQIPRDFSVNGAGPDVMLYALTALNYHQVILLPQAMVFFRAHSDSFTILNNENQVSSGYHAAISWFCKNNLSTAHWANYVARLWWADVKIKRSLVLLGNYSLSYEGRNSYSEITTLYKSAIILVMLDLFRIFYRSIKKRCTNDA